MSKYMNPDGMASTEAGHNQEFKMKCQENVTNYQAMIEFNFEKLINQSSNQQLEGPNNNNNASVSEKYNLAALQEKIKSFKFTKVNAEKSMENKDTHWFSKLQQSQQQCTPESQDLKPSTLANSPKYKIGGLNKFSLSKEEKIKFNQEMAQIFT